MCIRDSFRSVWAQSIAIALGGLLGALLCRRVTVPPALAFPVRYGHRRGIAFLAAFLIGLAGALLWPSTGVPTIAGLGAAFYRAGALVFGGGHVVLPLLQQAVVENGWVDANGFLAGYGAAQAMPGPMSVSYTHLDVYKRQAMALRRGLPRTAGLRAAADRATAVRARDSRRYQRAARRHGADRDRGPRHCAGRVACTCLLYTSRCV